MHGDRSQEEHAEPSCAHRDWRDGSAHIGEPFGTMLRRLRRERGLTLEDLTMKTRGGQFGHLSRIECGKAQPILSYLRALIDAFAQMGRPLTHGQRLDVLEADPRPAHKG